MEIIELVDKTKAWVGTQTEYDNWIDSIRENIPYNDIYFEEQSKEHILYITRESKSSYDWFIKIFVKSDYSEDSKIYFQIVDYKGYGLRKWLKKFLI